MFINSVNFPLQTRRFLLKFQEYCSFDSLLSNFTETSLVQSKFLSWLLLVDFTSMRKSLSLAPLVVGILDKIIHVLFNDFHICIRNSQSTHWMLLWNIYMSWAHDTLRSHHYVWYPFGLAGRSYPLHFISQESKHTI